MQFSIDEKWVIIDSNNRNIINAMKAALDRRVNDADNDAAKAQKAEIDSCVERPRDKLHAKMAAWVEGATGEIGSKEYYFKSVTKDLDYPAWILCDEYRKALYKMLLEQGKSSSDTEKDAINSRYVLVCEVLLRFAVVALSREENALRDGEKLINALNEFARIVREKGYLNDRGSLTPFSKFFSTQHEFWIKCLKDTITVIKSIHSHKKAVSDTLNYLCNVKYQTMRQIIAFLGGKGVTSDDLSDSWITQTFERIESTYLGEHEIVDPINPETQSTQWGVTAPQQNIIISKSRNAARVESLYKLLNDTNLLLSIAVQIDLLTNETGWVLIIMGAFKPGNLAMLIKKHQTRCHNLLNIEIDDPVFDEHLAKGLIKYQATSPYHLDNIANDSATNLAGLENPIILKRMTGMIGNSVNTLLRLQSQIEYPVVDKKVLATMTASLLPANQTSTQKTLTAPPARLATEDKSNMSVYSSLFIKK
jgi:hypothetical protein